VVKAVRAFVLVPLAITIGLAGCGSGSDADDRGGDEPKRYKATATVLERPGDLPELCEGAIAESYPPQCSGKPIVGWDWDDVENEESASGTTWGEYHVVGTWDGEQLTLTEKPTALVVPQY
jgi:hypothetical protein